MSIKVQIGADGKPFAEFETPAQAADFFRALSSPQSKPAETAPASQLPTASPHHHQPKTRRQPKASNSPQGASAFIESLKPRSRDILAQLARYESGVSTEEFAQSLGVDPLSLSGNLTAISKRARNAGLDYAALLESAPRFVGGKRVHWLKPKELLLQLGTYLNGTNVNQATSTQQLGLTEG